MMDQLRTRLKLSPLDVEEVSTITPEAMHLEIEGEAVRLIEDGEGVMLHMDRVYDCGSSMEAVSIIFDHFDVEATIPRTGRDMIQALLQAVNRDDVDYAKSLLAMTEVPEDSYEALLHWLSVATKFGEENLLTELYDKEAVNENINRGSPFPKYYEPDSHRH